MAPVDLRRAVVVADLRVQWQHMRQRRLSGAGTDTPLASAAHGLWLHAALAIGASGGFLFIQDEPGGLVREAREVLSDFMWACMVGHAGIAIAHQASGHGILQRTFGAHGVRPEQR